MIDAKRLTSPLAVFTVTWSSLMLSMSAAMKDSFGSGTQQAFFASNGWDRSLIFSSVGKAKYFIASTISGSLWSKLLPLRKHSSHLSSIHWLHLPGHGCSRNVQYTKQSTRKRRRRFAFNGTATGDRYQIIGRTKNACVQTIVRRTKQRLYTLQIEREREREIILDQKSNSILVFFFFFSPPLFPANLERLLLL